MDTSQKNKTRALAALMLLALIAALLLPACGARGPNVLFAQQDQGVDALGNSVVDYTVCDETFAVSCFEQLLPVAQCLVENQQHFEDDAFAEALFAVALYGVDEQCSLTDALTANALTGELLDYRVVEQEVSRNQVMRFVFAPRGEYFSIGYAFNMSQLLRSVRLLLTSDRATIGGDFSKITELLTFYGEMKAGHNIEDAVAPFSYCGVTYDLNNATSARVLAAVLAQQNGYDGVVAALFGCGRGDISPDDFAALFAAPESASGYLTANGGAVHGENEHMSFENTSLGAGVIDIYATGRSIYLRAAFGENEFMLETERDIFALLDALGASGGLGRAVSYLAAADAVSAALCYAYSETSDALYAPQPFESMGLSFAIDTSDRSSQQ